MAQSLTFFCPSCWRELSTEQRDCPYCGYDLSSYHSLEYEEKLLLAMRHPVAEYRYLAVQNLGMLGSERALPIFAEILRQEKADIYLIYQILQALSHIAGPSSEQLLREATSHPYPLVRRKARDLLRQKGERDKSVGTS